VLTEITAVITFALNCSGVRAVITAKLGPLISGVKNMAANNAATTTGHGGRNGSTQSGIENTRAARPESRSGATFRTATTATTLPASAPAPRAA